MRVKHYVMVAVVFLGLTHVLSSELKNENLLQTLPNGYKVDYQVRQDSMHMVEMVPQNESVKNWTEMVTTQVMLGTKLSPQEFQSRMQKMWASSCKDAEFAALRNGEENGYPFDFWMQFCPLNQATGKPEVTWFKAIQGNDSFYVVQKAFKFMPSKEQVVAWSEYLKSIEVCDTRLKGRECP